jgi:hypothetical protein
MCLKPEAPPFPGGPRDLHGDPSKGSLLDHILKRWHQLRTTPNGGGHPFRDPAFHETTVILVPLGPSVFVKHHFFDDDWLLFRFFCFSLLYVLYVIFIKLVEKNSVNAQPLSLRFLRKSHQISKTTCFLILVLYVCVFYTFLYFC